MRVKYICIAGDTVTEIPISRIENGKMFKAELANQQVTMMEMLYSTKDRRPYKLSRIFFSQVTFDQDGIYDTDNLENRKKESIIMEYAFYDVYPTNEKLPLPIPIPPYIPDKEEILLLKKYLNTKYPYLLKNDPRAIENSIEYSLQKYEGNKRLMKGSYR